MSKKYIDPHKMQNATLTVNVFINKLERERLNRFKRNLKKLIQKELSAVSVEISEINTFLFVRCEFPFLEAFDKEIRLNAEKKIKQLILEYNKQEIDLYIKKISNNIEIKDINKIVLSVIDTATIPESKMLREEIQGKSEHIENRVIEHVSNILNKTFVFTWDFTEYPSIVVLPGLFIKNEIDKDYLNLNLLTENLAVVQFGYVWRKEMLKMLNTLSFAIENLSIMFANEKMLTFLEKNMNKELWKTLRVTFGLLSATQQTLADLLKIVTRVQELYQELVEKVKSINFEPLYKYLIEIELQECCESDQQIIEKIRQNVKNTDKMILDLINKFREFDKEKTGDITSLIHAFSYALAEIQVIKFFTQRFRDIAFFESLPPSVLLANNKTLEMNENEIIKGVALFRSYKLFGSIVYALRGVNMTIRKGEMVAILGASGSGKTTLLNLLSGLDTPDKGGVFFKGENIHKLSDNEISQIRRKDVGFIFQYYNLIPQLTVVENVMLPGLMIGRQQRELKRHAMKLLKDVGIARFANQFPLKLSGGQMQRVTIARAMINDPELLFADEPTGDLDSTTGTVVVKLIKKLSKEKNMGVAFVTHDMNMAEICDRIVYLRDGKIIERENLK